MSMSDDYGAKRGLDIVVPAGTKMVEFREIGGGRISAWCADRGSLFGLDVLDNYYAVDYPMRVECQPRQVSIARAEGWFDELEHAEVASLAVEGWRIKCALPEKSTAFSLSEIKDRSGYAKVWSFAVGGSMLWEPENGERQIARKLFIAYVKLEIIPARAASIALSG